MNIAAKCLKTSLTKNSTYSVEVSLFEPINHSMTVVLFRTVVSQSLQRVFSAVLQAARIVLIRAFCVTKRCALRNQIFRTWCKIRSVAETSTFQVMSLLSIFCLSRTSHPVQETVKLCNFVYENFKNTFNPIRMDRAKSVQLVWISESYSDL